MSDSHGAQLYRLMWKIACMFGVPALTALFSGLLLDHFFGVDRKLIFAMLGVAFVFSWLLLFRFYRRMKEGEKVMVQPVSEEQNKATIDSSTIRYDTPGVWQSKKK